jgi:regulator of ribosome biosynthesis
MQSFGAKGQTFDIGTLLVEDSRSCENLTPAQFLEHTTQNFCELYKKLFEIKQKSEEQHPDGEFMEYTKSKFLIPIPEPRVILPREKPIPKDKALTKWEKFKLEKGLQTRQKRSRLVYDDITSDWVPRWGPYSKKKIEEKHQWLNEDKLRHQAKGAVDSFTEAK